MSSKGDSQNTMKNCEWLLRVDAKKESRVGILSSKYIFCNIT
jgi:hypothetical protein